LQSIFFCSVTSLLRVTAACAAVPGKLMPIASTAEAIEQAVNIALHVPEVGNDLHSTL
jgi:hypothetical protein